MAESLYNWKETTTKAVAPATAQTFGSIGATQPQTSNFTNSFSNILKEMQAQAPQTTPADPAKYDATLGSSFGQDTQDMAKKAIQGQLGATATGDSTASRLARSSFANMADDATRKMMESSALQGRAQTGQIAGDQMRYFQNTIAPEKQKLEAQLQTQEEAQAAAERQSGLSNLYNHEGLAQQAKQFASKQDFDLWAKKADLSDADRDRAFNAATQEIQNKFEQGERLGAQEFSLYSDSLKMKFEELQNELDRKQQMGIVDKQLEAEMARLEKTQRFADLQQKAQLAQDYDIAMQGLGLDREKLALTTKQIENDIAMSIEKLGIDKSLLADSKMKTQIELAGILTSMDNSEEMSDYAADLIFGAMTSAGYKPTTSTTTQKSALTTDPTTGKLTGTVNGIDVSKWYPANAKISDLEALVKSGQWSQISKDKGILDLKDSGIDATALDGESVVITDKATQERLFNGAQNKLTSVFNINGVPYNAIPIKVNDSGNGSYKFVAADGSGESRVLTFSLNNRKLKYKDRDGTKHYKFYW